MSREQDDRQSDCPDRHHELEPHVRPDRIATDRENEPERPQQQGRDPTEPTLEQHGARNSTAVAPMPPRRLDDPRCIASERRRQHLTRRVRNEVRPQQPRDALMDSARLEETLPAPRQRHEGQHDDRERESHQREARVRENTPRLAEVDLRDDVPKAQRRQPERQSRHGSARRAGEALTGRLGDIDPT